MERRYNKSLERKMGNNNRRRREHILITKTEERRKWRFLARPGTIHNESNKRLRTKRKQNTTNTNETSTTSETENRKREQERTSDGRNCTQITCWKTFMVSDMYST